MIVFDTNVVSEALKRLPSKTVTKWADALRTDSQFITAITVAEILAGVESLPQGRRRIELLASVERVFAEDFENRILVFDEAAARAYADITAARKRTGRRIPPLDAMICAIAKSQGAAVATRNVSHFQDCGIEVINPWGD